MPIVNQLRQFFEKVGEVIVADIKKDKMSNLSLGYGFVQFRTHEQAEKAEQTLNGTTLIDRKIRIGWAQKKVSLFVYFLNPTLTVAQVNDIFGQFEGLIPEETSLKGCYLVIKLRSKQLAENVKRQLDGKFWTADSGFTTEPAEEGTYPIRVSTALSQRNCVHLRFNPESTTINEAVLQEAFSKFGTVVNINLPRLNGISYKGFGFVHFEDSLSGEEGAAKAIASLDHTSIDGTVIDLNFGRKQPQKRPQRSLHPHGGYLAGGNSYNGIVHGGYSVGGGGGGGGGVSGGSSPNYYHNHNYNYNHSNNHHIGGNGGGNISTSTTSSNSGGPNSGGPNSGYRRSFNSYPRSRGGSNGNGNGNGNGSGNGNGNYSNNGGEQRGMQGGRYSTRGSYNSGGQSHSHSSPNQQGRNYKHPGFVLPLQQEYFYGYHPYGHPAPIYNPPSYPYPGANLSMPIEHYPGFDHTGKALPKMEPSSWYPTDQRALEEQQQQQQQQQRIQVEADPQSDQNL